MFLNLIIKRNLIKERNICKEISKLKKRNLKSWLDFGHFNFIKRRSEENKTDTNSYLADILDTQKKKYYVSFIICKVSTKISLANSQREFENVTCQKYFQEFSKQKGRIQIKMLKKETEVDSILAKNRMGIDNLCLQVN